MVSLTELRAALKTVDTAVNNIDAQTAALTAQVATLQARIAELEAAQKPTPVTPTPAPPPAPTPVPAPIPPAFSGFVMPDATNTGWGKEGRTKNLTVHTGDYTVTKDYEVIKDLEIRGRVLIGSHNGTVIDNCKITGAGKFSSEIRVIDCGNGTNTLVQFSEIYCESGWPGANGIGTKGYTIRRCNVHHVVDGMRLNRAGSSTQNSAVIEDNFIHDLILSPDPLYARDDKKTHSDGIQIEGCDSARIYGNNITGLRSTDGTSKVEATTANPPFVAVAKGTAGSIAHPQAMSAIMFSGSGLANVTIEKNWLDGGEVTINHRDISTGSIKDNRFGRNALQKVPIYPKTSSKINISGNIYLDTGTAV